MRTSLSLQETSSTLSQEQRATPSGQWNVDKWDALGWQRGNATSSSGPTPAPPGNFPFPQGGPFPAGFVPMPAWQFPIPQGGPFQAPYFPAGVPVALPGGGQRVWMPMPLSLDKRYSAAVSPSSTPFRLGAPPPDSRQIAFPKAPGSRQANANSRKASSRLASTPAAPGPAGEELRPPGAATSDPASYSCNKVKLCVHGELFHDS